MNTKELLLKLERQMQDNAMGIANIYEQAKELDNKAANRMLAGVCQYLEEKSNAKLLAALEDIETNWKMGFYTPQEYELKKKYAKEDNKG